MGHEEQEYKKEKKRIESLNAQMGVNAENLGLGYLDMNSRMLQMEETTTNDAGKWDTLRAEHKRRKERIENYWHDSTNDAVVGLQNKIPTDKKGRPISNQLAEYYANFTLKDLEIVIKNNKFGKNSQAYNDVATDLELLNALEGQAEEEERLELLGRLSESCQKYISSRNPYTSWGKCRKAMIEQLYSKVQAEEDKIKKDTNDAYQIIHQTEDKSQVPQETVEKALRGKFSLLTRSLKKQMKGVEFKDIEKMDIVPPEQDKQDDAELTEIAKAMLNYEIPADQSTTVSTRFFNAIGWAKRTPVKTANLEADVKNAPVKVKLYHSIAALPSKNKDKQQDASDMMNQLIGNKADSRQYLSSGNYGKGTYTAARPLKYQNDNGEFGYQLDQDASKHSWAYGETKGSMQAEMVFNQNAKIISLEHAKVLFDHFDRKYPFFSLFLTQYESNMGYQFLQAPLGASVILAFYGYNTIYIPSGADSTILDEKGKYIPLDYYVTFDRSAFSVDDMELQIRGEKEIEQYKNK